MFLALLQSTGVPSVERAGAHRPSHNGANKSHPPSRHVVHNSLIAILEHGPFPVRAGHSTRREALAACVQKGGASRVPGLLALYACTVVDSCSFCSVTRYRKHQHHTPKQRDSSADRAGHAL
jgi:hypothetical protein